MAHLLSYGCPSGAPPIKTRTHVGAIQHLCKSIIDGEEGPGRRKLRLIVFSEQRRLEQAVHRDGIVIS